MGKTGKQVSDQARVFRALEFTALGYKDYIGARALLINELPLQGAILGSTAVEKYVKALLALRGEKPGGHLKRAHIASLKNYAPELATKLNMEFLQFLQRCYLVRYTDILPPNFNLFVYSREVLAELDHTIFHLEFQMNFKRSDGTEATTMFRAAAQRSDQRLYSNNHVLLRQDKERFLTEPDFGVGIRNRPVRGLLEVEGRSSHSPTDGKFCREALIPMASRDQ